MEISQIDTADPSEYLMLFQKALERANGPLDADHIACVIMLATSEEEVNAALQQIEQAEYDFLLILLIHQIRHNKPMLRSYENVFEILSQGDDKAIEAILKISEYWKSGSPEFRRRVIEGVKGRLLKVLLSEDPEFVAQV